MIYMEECRWNNTGACHKYSKIIIIIYKINPNNKLNSFIL